MFQDDADLRDDNFGTHHGKPPRVWLRAFPTFVTWKKSPQREKDEISFNTFIWEACSQFAIFFCWLGLHVCQGFLLRSKRRGWIGVFHSWSVVCFDPFRKKTQIFQSRSAELPLLQKCLFWFFYKGLSKSKLVAEMCLNKQHRFCSFSNTHIPERVNNKSLIDGLIYAWYYVINGLNPKNYVGFSPWFRDLWIRRWRIWTSDFFPMFFFSRGICIQLFVLWTLGFPKIIEQVQKNPMKNGIFSISTGAGFLPLTVCLVSLVRILIREEDWNPSRVVLGWWAPRTAFCGKKPY